MNYLTHYYYNRDLKKSPAFHVGVAIPDLLSAFERKARIDFSLVDTLLERTSDRSQRDFFAGVSNHEHGDRVFHTSPFFQDYTSRLKGLLRAREYPGIRVRCWFLAHILLEIGLDHRLVVEEKIDVAHFYECFAALDGAWIEVQTGFLTARSIEGFAKRFELFKERAFLRHYDHLDGIIEATNRVLSRTRQDIFQGDNKEALREVLTTFLDCFVIPASLEELRTWKV